MQTLGTALQLSGSVITLCGLLYAWHRVTGFLTRLRGAIGERVSQLRTAIGSVRTGGPTHHTGGASIRIEVQSTATGVVTGRTPDQRITELERQFRTLDDRFQTTATNLRDEINNAIADALQQFQTQSNTVRLRDIYPALGGLVVSISGYLVALFC
jgi:hypothetical protein